MDREKYLEDIPVKFMVILREDYADNSISEEEFEMYKIELQSCASLEYKYGLYISYLIMRR